MTSGNWLGEARDEFRVKTWCWFQGIFLQWLTMMLDDHRELIERCGAYNMFGRESVPSDFIEQAYTTY